MATEHVSQVAAEVLASGGAARVSQLAAEILVVNYTPPMPLIYPTLPGRGYSSFWTSEFFNAPTEIAANGAELDIGISQYPLHQFELTYDVQRNTTGFQEEKLFRGFFLANRGNLKRFLYKNPDDYTVTGQVLGTTVGGTVLWTLVRTYGAGDTSGTEPIGYLDLTQDFNVYLNGALQDPSTYAIITESPVAQQIRFADIPTPGQILTVDMTYFYYCKFADPSMTFEKFMQNLWTIDKVTLKSCRPGT